MAQAPEPRSSSTISLDNDAPPSTLAGAAAANAGVLPTDVLFEVLLRLPADALCRLRLVCRSWRWLTRDPLFAAAHSSRHAHVLALVARPPGEIHVVDSSCGGHIVKRLHVGSEARMVYYMSSHHDVAAFSGGFVCSGPAVRNPCVLNVATGAAADLHGEVVVTLEEKHDAAMRRLQVCPPGYVIGRVPDSDSTRADQGYWYKILCVVYSYESGVRRRGVLVSSHVRTLAATGSGCCWRETTSRPPVTVAMDSTGTAVVGGTAYCMAADLGRIKLLLAKDTCSIALFDFAAERWRPAPLQGPPVAVAAGATGSQIGLSRLRGSVVVAVHSVSFYTDCSVDLWFLEDVESSIWTKRYTMRCTRCLEERHGLLHPLLVLGDGRVLAWADAPGMLSAYDPGTGTWTDVATLKGYSSVAMYRGAFCVQAPSTICCSIVL